MGQRASQQTTGPLRAILIHRAALAVPAPGEVEIYTVSQGDDAPFSVVDGAGVRQVEVPLEVGNGAWAVTARPAGGCWVGSYFKGMLYRWDGSEVTELGLPTPETRYIWDATAIADDTVVVATYPDAAFVKHDPDNGFTLLRRFGSEAIMYGRAVCFDPATRTLWCGIGVAPNQVVGFSVDDPAGELIEIDGFPANQVTRELVMGGGKVWTRTDNEVWVVEPQTRRASVVVDETNPTITGYLSQEHQGGIYFSDATDTLRRIDVATHQVTTVATLPIPEAIVGSAFDGDEIVLLLSSQRPQLVRVNVVTGAVSDPVAADVAAVPPHMGNVMSVPGSPDVIVAAGQQGDVQLWSQPGGELGEALQIGQVESWAWGPDGKLYTGTYPSARMVQLEMHAASHESGRRPEGDAVWATTRILCDLHDSHHQSRPISIFPTTEAVFMGTTPGYGLTDGGLSRVDLETDELTFRSMEQESVHALAVVERQGSRQLLVGTSPESGTGAPRHDGAGRLLVVDPLTLETIVEHPAPGGARTLAAIAQVGDSCWLVADHGLWKLDLETLSASHLVDLGDGESSRATIEETPYGLVVHIDRVTWLVDVETGTAENLGRGCAEVTLVGDELWGPASAEGSLICCDVRKVSLA